MKLNVFVPPLISLAIVGVWVLPDWTGSGRENARGESGVAERNRRKVGESAAEQQAFDPEKADWLTMGKEMERLKTAGQGDKRSALARACRSRIQLMTAGEILEALEETGNAPDFQGEAKTLLQNEFYQALVTKGPALLVRHFQKDVGKEDFRPEFLHKALTQYATDSPREAVSWLDEVIAEGAFDSSGTARFNSQWLACESALVSGLTSQHLELAGQRLEGLPAGARESLLPHSMLILDMTPELQSVNVKLWRRFLGQERMEEFLRSLTDVAAMRGGQGRAVELMDRVGVSAEERAALAPEIAMGELAFIARSRQPGPEDVDKVRQWVISQGSGDGDGVTGSAYGFLAGLRGVGTDRAFEMILSEHGKSGSDALLARFLAWPVVWENQERALELANRIQDPDLRRKSSQKP